MADTFERRSVLRAGLSLGLTTLLDVGRAAAASKSHKQGQITPSKTQVQTRSAPLKEAKTALIPFETAPFPYRGNIPGTDTPFLNVNEAGRRGHRTGSGRVY